MNTAVSSKYLVPEINLTIKNKHSIFGGNFAKCYKTGGKYMSFKECICPKIKLIVQNRHN